MIWFTLEDGDSIAVAPEHVRYIRPTEDGGIDRVRSAPRFEATSGGRGDPINIHFSRDERFTVTQTPTEVAAKLR